jgi:NTE family protein
MKRYDFRLSASLSLVSLLVLSLLADPVVAQPSPAEPDSDAPVAQAPAATRRPKIGLALGGGAARGFAHIGVLEWFEANQIPIDYVAGTSMGGLVAGAYATGMSPQEIRALMKEVDWDNMFLADSPYKFKSFRRREDARAFPSQLKFGLKGGFQVPTGVNPGQRILWLLNRIALPYGVLDSFDSLPTPFRCVATDLIKSEAVVLDKGNLSLAMRATMAIPAVFTPVQMGDRLMVDGGTLNNIPADVVRAMGADVVIAVDVAADVTGNDKAKLTLFGVMGKTIDTMMMPGIRNALKSADFVIDPDLTGLTALDWRKSDDLAERGLAATTAMGDRLSQYRVDTAVWAAHQAERARKRATAKPEIAFVKVTGLDEDSAKLITRAVSAAPGTPVDVVELEASLANLTGNDLYDTVGYRLEYEDGKPGLVLDVTPKAYAPPFLFLAFDLQNIDSNSFAANFRGRTVFTDVVNAGSEVRADFTVGTNQYLGGELFLPVGRTHEFVTLGGGRFYFMPRVYFSRDSVNGYIDDELIAEYIVKETGGGLDVGFTSGRRSQLRVGYDIADVRARRRIGDPILPEAEGTNRYASLKFTFDGFTSPIVPTRGSHIDASLRRYFDAAQTTSSVPGLEDERPNQFWQGEVDYWQFFRVRGVDRLFYNLAGGTSFGEEPRGINVFSLGGPFRVDSLNQDELRGPNFLLATTGYMKELFRLPDFLGGSVLAGAWVGAGSTFEKLDQAQFEFSGAGGLIAETLFGPMFAGVSSGSTGGFKLYVALGPLFRTARHAGR